MSQPTNSPPAFSWDAWYASVGGRQISIDEVDAILSEIREYQYPKFDGEVNKIKVEVDSPEQISLMIKRRHSILAQMRLELL